MKLVSLEAENFKRLKAFKLAISEDQHLVIFEGKNGAGKTSALDILWAAIDYAGFKKENPRPLFDGADAGHVTVFIGNLKVTRKWTSNEKTYLQVETADGMIAKSPQGMLDELTSNLTVDPLAFSRLNAKEQRQVLINMLGLGNDLDELEAKRQQIFDERTDLNRTHKSLLAQYEAIPTPAEAVPEQEVSLHTIMLELDEANAHNKAWADAVASHDKAIEDIEKLGLEIKALENEITVKRNQIATQTANLKGYRTEVEKLGGVAGRINTDLIKEKGKAIDETNKLVRQVMAKKQLGKQITEIRNQIDARSMGIQTVDTEKANLLKGVALPIPGMEIGEDCLLINGFPLTQCSAAEQLRISTWIAMAMHPKLRVLRIEDGSLLDPDNLGIIKSMAEEKDFTVLMERVGDGKTGLLIEEGELRNASGV